MGSYLGVSSDFGDFQSALMQAVIPGPEKLSWVRPIKAVTERPRMPTRQKARKE
jgi:hypothetical protein